MLSEALVLFACGTNHGCTETSNQYARENPEIVKNIEHEEKRLELLIGPTVINTLGPVAFFIGGGTSNVKLHDDLYLQVNRQQGLIMVKKEFK